MSDGEDFGKKVVPLNEVIDLIEAITSGRLKTLLKSDSESGCPEKCGVDCVCHIADCICHNIHCKCHGAVLNMSGDMITVEEFLRVREVRVADLRRQLQSLELPEGLNKPDSSQ